MEITQIILFVIVGIIAGTTAGLAGLGGGIFYVPALLWFLESESFPNEQIPVVAVSTSLAIIFVSILNGVRTHWKNKNINFKLLPYLLGGGLIGAVIAALLLAGLDSARFKPALALFQLAWGIKMLMPSNRRNHLPLQGEKKRTFTYISTGIFAGAISAFFGIGGGLITVPLLYWAGRIKMAIAVGTSMMFMVFVVFSGLLTHLIGDQSTNREEFWIWGTIHLPAFLAITPTAFLFNRFGAQLANTIDGKALKKILGLVLVVVGMGSFLRQLIQ